MWFKPVWNTPNETSSTTTFNALTYFKDHTKRNFKIFVHIFKRKIEYDTLQTVYFIVLFRIQRWIINNGRCKLSQWGAGDVATINGVLEKLKFFKETKWKKI